MEIKKESIITVTDEKGNVVTKGDNVLVHTKDRKVLFGTYDGLNNRGAMTFYYADVVMNIMPSSIAHLRVVDKFELR